ncbi:ABC transporter substrate-binding protein [Natronorubrum sp. FCH18a]|uniref:ABC transporter substrate-binding protein n=1 Tax=Natronorubrum sp. FCH18a TaxID=3447018 RepID=UPI003F511A3A
MAGCFGGSDDNTFRIGGTIPSSGPYGEIGVNQRDGLELAVNHAEEEDLIDQEIELEFVDTETDPSVGRRRAQELIDDGVDLLVGNFSSSVALAISELAQREGIIYICVGGSNAITGEDCQPNTFNAGNSAVMQTSGGLQYVLEEGLGESVYELSSDYSWGQSIQEWNEQEIVPEYDAEYVGNTWTELGQDDLSSELTTAANSDADIISFNHFSADHVTSANQAGEFGLLDDHICVWPATEIIDADQIDSEVLAHDNFYSSTPWYWEHDAEPAQEFSDAFYDQYDERPLGFTASIYAGSMTTLEVIDEIGTAAPDEVRPNLEDRELTPQLWGNNERFRACDHRASITTFTVQGRDSDEIDEQNFFEIVNAVDDPEGLQMRACDETGCDL